MESIMCFFDETVRQRQQSKNMGGAFRLTDDAENLLFDFAKSKQSTKLSNDDETKFKAFFEECMDHALHCRNEKPCSVSSLRF
jgi:hypothetical protein